MTFAYQAIPVLDEGYVQPIETWGSDARIIEAARMSTAKGFLGWGPRCKHCNTDGEAGYCNAERESHGLGHEPVPGDEKLLRYLWEHKHATPFEMAGLVIEVKAPIMVFREWHRHRTQSYNEMSARYVPLPNHCYIPSAERIMAKGEANKQAAKAAGAANLTEEQANQYRNALAKMYDDQEILYQSALGWGVPKELARLHLGVGRYSCMRASANLRNWLGFLALRLDQSAQWEIREYAGAVGECVAAAFPRTWALFSESKQH